MADRVKTSSKDPGVGIENHKLIHPSRQPALGAAKFTLYHIPSLSKTIHWELSRYEAVRRPPDKRIVYPEPGQ
jgi:hypothetical protein